MLVEYAKSPLAIGTRCPRFSWEVKLAGRNRRQSAYRILVATDRRLLTTESADLWDSGRVVSAQSANIEYRGLPLRSNADYVWRVQIWDDVDQAGAWSEPACFGTGLLDGGDWHAKWIGMGSPDEPVSDPDAFQREGASADVQAFEPDARAPALRKTFTLEKPVRRARVFACGLGFGELRLNGQKVGDDVLSTPRTDFRKRIFYSTYDVADQLRMGENAIGLLLGNGWFNGQKKYWGWQMQWFGSPRAIVQVEVEHQDGSRSRVVSDESWLGDWSSIVSNCLFDGETVDWRLQQSGWDEPGFAPANWRQVNVLASPGGELIPVMHEPERIVETFRPVSVREPEPGVFVFDLGKNITGWVRLLVKGGKAGETVTLRYGEAQHENGALNASSNNRALQRDQFVLAGADETVCEPRFTFHGFQFVEIAGYPGTPDLASVTACFVRTAVPCTGTFACGHALINKIHICTLQSQLCNIQMGVPTDDTQRPERQGWGADAWATAHEALYNLWMPRLYEKWIGDFRDQQDALGIVGMIAPQAGFSEDLVWSAAFVLIPWWVYLHCGDRRILEENYPALRRYLDFLKRVAVKEVATQSPEVVIDSLLWRSDVEGRFPAEADQGHLQISQWGDHLATAEGSATRSNLPLSVATAFYYLDVDVMGKIADVLGKGADAAHYRELASEIRTAFNARFLDACLGYYDTGVQSAQAWPLAFGMVPEEYRERVGRYFARSVGDVQRRLTTGYVGTKFAIQALSMLGRDDLIWKLATSTDYPSWGHMLRNNRTTSCERWDGDGGSLNHAPLGAAIDEWFYWGLAGIRPDERGPGFAHFRIEPYMPANLAWVKASLQTIHGEISCAWRHDDRKAALEVIIPANTEATLCLRVATPGAIREGNMQLSEADGVQFLHADDEKCHFILGSGGYAIEFPYVL